jgi:hypothetical protein
MEKEITIIHRSIRGIENEAGGGRGRKDERENEHYVRCSNCDIWLVSDDKFCTSCGETF